MPFTTTITVAQTTRESQEELLIGAVRSVKNLVAYKLGSRYRSETEDLLQKITCRLLAWHGRRQLELPPDEWLKIAKTCVTREVAAFFAEKLRERRVAVDNQSSAAMTEPAAAFEARLSQPPPTEGNSAAEVSSLLRQIFALVADLPDRQRYSLMLGSEFLISELIMASVCTIDELGALFDITRPQMIQLIGALPLSEANLLEFISLKLEININRQQLWEARSRAKSKLLRQMNCSVSDG